MQSWIVALLALALSVTAAAWSYGADARPLPKVPSTTAEAMRSVLDDLGGKFFFFLFCAKFFAVKTSPPTPAPGSHIGLPLHLFYVPFVVKSLIPFGCGGALRGQRISNSITV